MATINALFALDAGADADVRAFLERFVGEALADGGVWPSWRTSDGVSRFRFVERGPARVRVCGQIWDIGQEQLAFWLDAEREGTDSSWTLYFDIDATAVGERRARTLLDAIAKPEDAVWRVTLTGVG